MSARKRINSEIADQDDSIAVLSHSSSASDYVGSGSTETSSSPKLLSCQRCRTRKVKCNFEYPCSSCLKVGVECVRTVNDMRKKRPPANYVSNLEKKVNNLIDFFRKFKSLESAESRKELIDKTDLEELINRDILNSSGSGPTSQAPSQSQNRQSPSSQHHEDSVEDRAVYGPTSVYDDNLISKNSSQKRSEESSSSIKILNQDPDVLHCIKLFFIWQYPDHNMFIFREAFLIDFFDPKPTSLYCSKILILSICALGSRMSDNDRIYHKSRQYYNEAKSLLLSSMSHPSITSLQSFLLLAFYDICNGSNSSGWMLSGSAMRMGFDLGFQLNPEVWFVKSKEDLNPLDVDIRSRVYWGCYVADHFISLLLGRPSLLKMSDASIPETNDLPDLEWIDEYTYHGSLKKQSKGQHPKLDQSYISNPLKQIINLINISDNMLSDIFTKSEIENDQSNNEDLDLISRLEKLTEYNAQIMKWKNSLPPDVQWDRQSLKETADNPTFTSVRYYYYILVLCLNRPFVGIVKKKLKNNQDSLSPLTICSEAIEDLYEGIRKFQSVHGFERVSIFMVYCSILSISIILLTNTAKQMNKIKRDSLQFFMDVLRGCSKTWRLAEKSYNLIKIKLKQHSEESDDTPSTPIATSGANKYSINNKDEFVGDQKKPTMKNKIRSMESPKSTSRISLPQPVRPSRNPPPMDFPNPPPPIMTYRNASPGVSSTIHSDQNRIGETLQSQEFSTVPIVQSAPANMSNIRNGSSQLASQNMSIQSTLSEDSRSSSRGNNSPHSVQSQNQSIVESNTDILFDENLDFLGGPPVLMTSDLFNEDWESLFPDYIFNPKN